MFDFSEDNTMDINTPIGSKIRFSFHRAKYYHSQWYYYIIPRRLTLKCNPPIYKWLWFVISYEKGE